MPEIQTTMLSITSTQWTQNHNICSTWDSVINTLSSVLCTKCHGSVMEEGIEDFQKGYQQLSPYAYGWKITPSIQVALSELCNFPPTPSTCMDCCVDSDLVMGTLWIVPGANDTCPFPSVQTILWVFEIVYFCRVFQVNEIHLSSAMELQLGTLEVRRGFVDICWLVGWRRERRPIQVWMLIP